MYRVTHVRLVNFCQHGSLSEDVGEGITAVIGPNGSGKTSLARGVVYGLTGLVDGLWGDQKMLQKDGAASLGFAEVWFDGGGRRYFVRRCTSSSTKFPDIVVDRDTGDIVVSRRQAVNAFMADVLGMPVQLMFQICWGRQGELAMLLKAPPATVGSFLQQVFDIRALERLRDVIKVQLDTVATLSPDCTAALEADRRALEAIPGDDELSAAVDAAGAGLEAARAAYNASLVASSSGMAEAERDARLSAAASEAAALKARLDAAVRPDSFPDEPLEELDRRLSEARSLRSSLGERIRGLDAALSVAAAQAGALSDRVKTLQDEADGMRRLLGEDDGGDGCCRFCGAPVHDQAAYATRVAEHVLGGVSRDDWFAESAGRIGGVSAELGAKLEASARMEEERSSLSAREREAAEAEASLQSARDAAAYRDALARLDALCADVARLAECAVAPADAAERLSACAAEVSRWEASLRGAVEARALASGRRSMLQAAVADDEKAVAQYSVNAGARDALSFIRDAMSQPRAQARYLKDRVQLLNIELSRYLSYTGMPFTLRLDPDTRGFVYTTPEGAVHPAQHLSGAQQAMAAVAFQMALFSVMRPNMNLYLMDEPTEALDTDNKAVMFGMFSRLNAMLPSVGGSMLLITRDEPVVESCSHVISLGGAGRQGDSIPGV